ncbi:MAPEG family protein, partial [Chromatiaceae bacterium AAb-1]|nr:MAPEG family protein [Chromatiaceae bacterium AAb-1]
VRHYGEIFMIWTIYAALLSLFFAFLTFRTIRLRQRYRVSLGHGKNLLLMRAIRVHGNFAEYVPLGLLLMAASEQLGAPSLLVHSLGSLLALGRLVHAYGVSQENEVLRFRVTGMALTCICYVLAAGYILLSAFSGNA